jgi:hypothetical protein
MAADNSEWQEEWKRARDIIEKCDERTHETRKLGFTFVSTLLSTETLVWYKAPGSLAPGVGFALLLVVLGILFAVRILEKQTQLIQSSAATRARTLELLSSIELTDVLTDRSRRDAWAWYGAALHVLFAGIAIMICLVVSTPPAWTVASMAAAAIYAGILVRLTLLDITISPGVDLSLDKVTCEVGDAVTIVAFNLHNERRRIAETLRIRRVSPATREQTNFGALAMVDEYCKELIIPRKSLGFTLEFEDYLRPHQSFMWQWLADKAGVYCLEFIDPAGRPKTLRKMIRVTPKAAAKIETKAEGEACPTDEETG